MTNNINGSSPANGTPAKTLELASGQRIRVPADTPVKPDQATFSSQGRVVSNTSVTDRELIQLIQSLKLPPDTKQLFKVSVQFTFEKADRPAEGTPEKPAGRQPERALEQPFKQEQPSKPSQSAKRGQPTKNTTEPQQTSITKTFVSTSPYTKNERVEIQRTTQQQWVALKSQPGPPADSTAKPEPVKLIDMVRQYQPIQAELAKLKVIASKNQTYLDALTLSGEPKPAVSNAAPPKIPVSVENAPKPSTYTANQLSEFIKQLQITAGVQASPSSNPLKQNSLFAKFPVPPLPLSLLTAGRPMSMDQIKTALQSSGQFFESALLKSANLNRTTGLQTATSQAGSSELPAFAKSASAPSVSNGLQRVNQHIRAWMQELGVSAPTVNRAQANQLQTNQPLANQPLANQPLANQPLANQPPTKANAQTAGAGSPSLLTGKSSDASKSTAPTDNQALSLVASRVAAKIRSTLSPVLTQVQNTAGNKHQGPATAATIQQTITANLSSTIPPSSTPTQATSSPAENTLQAFKAMNSTDMKAWLAQTQLLLLQSIQTSTQSQSETRQILDGLIRVLFPSAIKPEGASQNQKTDGLPVVPRNLSIQPEIFKFVQQLVSQNQDDSGESQQLRQLLNITQNLTRIQQDQVLNRQQQVQQPDSPDFQFSLPYMHDKSLSWCEIDVHQSKSESRERQSKSGWHLILRFSNNTPNAFAIEASLSGIQLSISLWSENQHQLSRLHQHLDLLREKLHRSGFLCEQLQTRRGMPAKKQRQINQSLVDVRT